MCFIQPEVRLYSFQTWIPPALISHACAHVRSTGDTYCLKDGSPPSEVLVNNGLSATLKLLQL